MRGSRVAFLGFLVIVPLAGGAACGSFSGSAVEPTVDGAVPTPPVIDGGAEDGPASDDAAADGESGDASAICPAPKAPPCGITSCSQRVLYMPSTPGYPFQLATDSSHIYWVEQPKSAVDDAYNGNAPGRILRAAIAGPPVATELAADQPSPVALALLGPHVYWATWNGTNTSTLHRTLAACSPPSCTDESVAALPSRVLRLAAAPSALFALASDGKLYRIPVASNGALGASSVVLTTGSLPGMALSSTHVYASNLVQTTVRRATIDGVSKQLSWVTLSSDAGNNPGITNLATDCTYLYGARNPQATITRISIADGGVSDVALLPAKAVYDVAADAKYVYAGALNGGGIYAIDSASGAVTAIDANASAFSIAVDSAGVYWGDHASSGGNGGTITMMEKK